MDHIDTTFTNAIKPDSDAHPAICYALQLAEKTLNKCYSLTDEHKLEYFRQAGWTSEWIDSAESLVRDEFERSYAANSDSSRKDKNDHDSDRNSISESVVQEERCKSTNIFDNLPALKKPPKSKVLLDELRLYLSAPPETTHLSLRWWFEKRQTYPRLHRMALDYLSIPATSTDVGRLFSRGHLILPHTRSRLSTESTHAFLCLGSWSLAGLVKDLDVEAVTVLDV
ncbi:hypothetical protein GALMADRAFT_134522 [Galerina marginata CBS 339.88]|uniref:HAT C-terminal dimerisation domain-containing protein n=1 Tax=Galerina marginata (strain CBS 339.88) TaxID=685588 RepID=A0A067TSZ6_GALM3|nr:hypothetical protein GALMADRAFT_134522 [Galerina marginata CBS 339.88]